MIEPTLISSGWIQVFRRFLVSVCLKTCFVWPSPLKSLGITMKICVVVFGLLFCWFFLSCNGISLIMEHCNVTAKSVLVSFKKKSQKTLFNYKLCQILAKIAYLLLSKEKQKKACGESSSNLHILGFFFKFETWLLFSG